MLLVSECVSLFFVVFFCFIALGYLPEINKHFFIVICFYLYFDLQQVKRFDLFIFLHFNRHHYLTIIYILIIFYAFYIILFRKIQRLRKLKVAIQFCYIYLFVLFFFSNIPIIIYINHACLAKS